MQQQATHLKVQPTIPWWYISVVAFFCCFCLFFDNQMVLAAFYAFMEQQAPMVVGEKSTEEDTGNFTLRKKCHM